MVRIFFTISVSLALLFSGNVVLATNNKPTDKHAQINVLKQRISNLRKKLTTEKKQQKQLTDELKKTEKEINHINHELQELSQKLLREKTKLYDIETHRLATESDIESQQEQIADQIRVSYRLNQQDPIKFLLNQQSPDALSRTMTYFHYFNQSRQQLIEKLNIQLQELDQQSGSLQKEYKKLKKIRAEQESQQKQLKLSQQKRQDLLNQIDSTIKKGSNQLAQYEQDKKRLEKVVSNLTKNRNQYGEYVPPKRQKTFRQMRHFLPWPTEGKLVRRYGTPIAHSDLKWNGVLLRAQEGTQVKAVHPGKVVFADWLKGFGELIIIDHGSGFMTLYSRNSQILKKVGDYVSANEAIAEVGNSGGFGAPGLYFELRFNGEHLNPETWLKGHRYQS